MVELSVLYYQGTGALLGIKLARCVELTELRHINALVVNWSQVIWLAICRRVLCQLEALIINYRNSCAKRCLM